MPELHADRIGIVDIFEQRVFEKRRLWISRPTQCLAHNLACHTSRRGVRRIGANFHRL